MAEYRAHEDPTSPLSLQGVAKSSFVLMSLFKERSAPQIAFGLAITLWVCFFCIEPACLSPDDLRAPIDNWKTWILHAFAPRSFLRTSLLGTLLLTFGYSCEDRIGMIHFLGLFISMHYLLASILLYFNLTLCFYGLETTLVALAPVFHKLNPVFHSDSVSKNIKVPFVIEPRWHYWILIFILMWTRSPFNAEAIYSYFTGLAAGTLYVFRQPDAWNVKLNLMWPKLIFYFLAVLFVPVTTYELGVWDGPTTILLSQTGFLGAGSSVVSWSYSLLPLCTLACAYDMFWIPKVVYSVSSALLAMYSMNSQAWSYPGPGFLAFGLLVIAFLLPK